MKKLFNLFESLWARTGKYLVALVILTVPLYPKFPFLNIPGTYVSIRLEDFIIFFVCAIWFLSKLRTLFNVGKDPLWRAFLLFWGIGLLATITGIVITQTVQPFAGLLNWARRIEYMILFLVCLDLKVTKKEIQFFLACFATVIFYSFIYGVGQKYLDWPIITTQNSEYSKGIALRYMEGGHIVSTFAGHYDLASFLILATPVLCVFAAHFKKWSTAKGKSRYILPVFFVVASVVGTWLLANAASRISILSFVGAVSLALLLARRIYLIPVVFLVVFVVAATSTSLVDRYMNILDVLVKNVSAADVVTLTTPEPTPTPIPPVEDRSTNIRLAVEWPRAIRAFTKNPLLGGGYSSITLATDNDYLRSLGEVGILGSLSFGLCFFLILKELFTRYVKIKEFTTAKLMAAAAIGMLPGVLLNMVFIDILEASKFAILFWIFLGISISHLRQK